MDLMVIGGFIVATIVITGLLNHYRKKRVESVATELGLEFQGKVDLLHELNGFELLSANGRGHKCFNCFGGEADGVAFKIFQFKFSTGHGKRKQTHSQTVALIKLDHLALPNFQVTAKCLFSKMFSKPVNRFDVDEPVFAKKFWTCSTEIAKAKSLFNAEIIQLLLDKNCSVESNNGRLLIYQRRKTVSHSKLKGFLTSSLQLMMEFEEATMNPNAAMIPNVSVAGQESFLQSDQLSQ